MQALYYQKALCQEIKNYPTIAAVITKIYTFKPVDHTPPYIYLAMHDFTEMDDLGLQYGTVNIFLIVRESGVVQSNLLNRDLYKLLNQLMIYITEDSQFTFTTKILDTACATEADGITKTYHYRGRLKIKQGKQNEYR